MKVIVSKDLEDIYKDFVLVDSLQKVRDLQGVTTLVIHNYKESDFDAGVFVSSFHKSGISKFVYINQNPSVVLRMVIKGVNGFYFEDEFYLEDEEELLSLLKELGVESDEENTSLAVASLEIVNEFVEAFSRNEERIKAPLYLEQVNQAIVQLSDITQHQQLQINAMGTSAIEVFEKANKIISAMDEQRKLIEGKLKDLEESNNNQISSRPTLGNSIMFFSPVKYTGSSKVLLIREYSPCKYLTSFILAYTHHLHFELNKRVKLIFVHQKSAGVSSKYSEFSTAITQENYTVSSLFDAEIIATNNPKKEIMKELLSKPNDIFIVVDRLYGAQDIVSGRVTKVSAVSGNSDLKRFKLNAGDCIFSVSAREGALFTIPTIKKFPQEMDARYAAYSQINSDKYAILDRKLDLKQ